MSILYIPTTIISIDDTVRSDQLYPEGGACGRRGSMSVDRNAMMVITAKATKCIAPLKLSTMFVQNSRSDSDHYHFGHGQCCLES
jgi:hypothetical protein